MHARGTTGIELKTLVKKAKLTRQQIEDRGARINVHCQIEFLNLTANALRDDFLGLRGVVESLRRDLALQYLANQDLSISRIAWLLGYQEVSAFTHAFKRWTGKTPRHARRLRAESCESGNKDMKPTGDEARNEASARISDRVRGQARSLK
jgi:AraC-like DNA-binding protein